MSAWTMGRRQAERTRAVLANPFAELIDRVVTWIPGDTLVLYALTIAALEGVDPSPNPSVSWMLVFWLLTPLLSVFGAFAVDKRQAPWRIGLSFVAFGIWSLGIPNSGWWAWPLVSDNPIPTVLAVLVLGLLFGAFAEGLSRARESAKSETNLEE